MNCNNVQPLLDGYADGELDLVRHVAIEEHLQDCTACSERAANLRSLKSALSPPELYYRAPAELLAKLEMPAHAPTPMRRKRLLPLIASGALSSLAVALAIFLLVALRDKQFADDRIAESVVACHIRSLQAEHLMDVASTDQHTVKPWFRGKLDFSPPVTDLKAQGYALTGGRLDYVADRAVAALVYQRRAHVVNVFIWPSASDDASQKAATVHALSRHGYQIRSWQRSGINYWVVSDINDRELDELVKLLSE